MLPFIPSSMGIKTTICAIFVMISLPAAEAWRLKFQVASPGVCVRMATEPQGCYAECFVNVSMLLFIEGPS